MSDLAMWFGFFTIWRRRQSNSYVLVQAFNPRLQGRSCIDIYDTALQVIQHTLLVEAITNLPRLIGRGTRLYLLTGMGQDPIVDGYVGQEVLLQSFQKNTACYNPHFSHINSHSPYMQNTCIPFLKPSLCISLQSNNSLSTSSSIEGKVSSV